MHPIATLEATLKAQPKRWLVTGVAGFIGSNILRRLLQLNQDVVGLDNFLTGHQANLDRVLAEVGPVRAKNFRFIEGDIRDLATCQAATQDVQLVLHQAALGSVPWSVDDPLTSHAINVDGFIHMLQASREAGVETFVYASSSAIYGDDETLPKVEHLVGQPLSPYAATKICDEHIAQSFVHSYGMRCVGLRYFNVFGPQQDPNGPYAAVIPRWIDTLLAEETCLIFGDGTTSRDFSFVENIIDANLLAAHANAEAVALGAFNIGNGDRTSLNELYQHLRDAIAASRPQLADKEAEYHDFRTGDILHSNADISRALEALGYVPRVGVKEGLERTIAWYNERLEG